MCVEAYKRNSASKLNQDTLFLLFFLFCFLFLIEINYGGVGSFAQIGGANAAYDDDDDDDDNICNISLNNFRVVSRFKSRLVKIV